MDMHWEARGFGMWAVEERDGGELVGRIGLLFHPDSPAGEDRVEIAWSLQQDRWGRGYATEGALAARDWGSASRGSLHWKQRSSRSRLGFQQPRQIQVFAAGMSPPRYVSPILRASHLARL